MANVRIAQIGQITINRPVYEVTVENKRYAMAADGNGSVEFINRKSLRNFGLFSSLAMMFQDEPDTEFARCLQLNQAEMKCKLDGRFPITSLPLGPALVSDYSYSAGWQNAAPAKAQTFEA